MNKACFVNGFRSTLTSDIPEGSYITCKMNGPSRVIALGDSCGGMIGLICIAGIPVERECDIVVSEECFLEIGPTVELRYERKK